MKESSSDKKLRKKRRAQRRIRQKHNCPNCGGQAPHFVVMSRGDAASLSMTIPGADMLDGFWTCSIYYGKEGDRRRLPDSEVRFPPGYPRSTAL